MSTLIIYAHPNKQGHCGTYLKKVEELLIEQKEDYKLLDLYQMGFNPILTNDEHPSNKNKNINNKDLEQITQLQLDVKNSSKLIFIYPNWWNSVPAILKGFFDRVFSAHFAFKYVNKLPVGLLKNKKAIILSSTGAPLIYDIFFMRSRFVNTIKKSILEFCGIKTKSFIVHNANRLTKKNKNKINKIIKSGFKFLYSQ